jgi:uncharacterized OsmC-like protein
MSENTVQITLRQQKDYQFDVDFGGGIPVLVADEPAPLGSGQGPSPVQLLAAAVGNCLSDSLLFALRKFKQAPEPVGCTVTAEVGRNDQNRLRVLKMTAVLGWGLLRRRCSTWTGCWTNLKAYCTVTQSVGLGIAIELQVIDAEGVRLK